MSVRICNPGPGTYVCPAGGVIASGEFLDVADVESVAADLERGRIVLVTDASAKADSDEGSPTPSRRRPSTKPNKEGE